MAILIPTTITVTLDNDQIKALPTTPGQIVPAPGLGKILVPITSLWVLDTSGGAYTVIESLFPTLTMDGNQISAYVGSLVSDLGNVGVVYKLAPCLNPSLGSADFADSLIHAQLAANTPIMATFAGTVPIVTGGHADNTLKVTVLYVVIDV